MRLRSIFDDIYDIGCDNDEMIKQCIDKLDNILHWIQIYLIQDSNATNTNNTHNNFGKLFNDLGYSIGGVLNEQKGYVNCV